MTHKSICAVSLCSARARCESICLKACRSILFSWMTRIAFHWSEQLNHTFERWGQRRRSLILPIESTTTLVQHLSSSVSSITKFIYKMLACVYETPFECVGPNYKGDDHSLISKRSAVISTKYELHPSIQHCRLIWELWTAEIGENRRLHCTVEISLQFAGYSNAGGVNSIMA